MRRMFLNTLPNAACAGRDAIVRRVVLLEPRMPTRMFSMPPMPFFITSVTVTAPSAESAPNSSSTNTLRSFWLTFLIQRSIVRLISTALGSFSGTAISSPYAMPQVNSSCWMKPS